MNNQRVVITGLGAICSICKNIDEFAFNLKNGVSGLKRIPEERFSTDFTIYKNKKGCVIDNGLFKETKEKDITLLRCISNIAIKESLDDAGLRLEDLRTSIVGLSIGTSVGASFSFMEFVKKQLNGERERYADLLFNSGPTIAGSIAKDFFLNGPISTVSTACASGTNSIGRAYDFIKNERADIMIAGGVDIFTELTFSGFNSLQAIALDHCKPFDKNRDGLNLGDAAAFLILESYNNAISRGAKIYAEIKGYSIANEAYHSTAPSPDGESAYKVMLNSLNEGNIKISEIDYINAHGTGTKANDSMELNAINRLLAKSEKKVFISSTKSLIGHTLGAAGSIELVATIIGMDRGFIPPSINVYDSMIDSKNIVLVQDRAIEENINVALSNSFGFAGNVASIVIKKLY